jgi:hypothetical protein
VDQFVPALLRALPAVHREEQSCPRALFRGTSDTFYMSERQPSVPSVVECKSSIPFQRRYEGKVELRNKQAGTALVRIPMWVDLSAVKSCVNSEQVRVPNAGRNLVLMVCKREQSCALTFQNLNSRSTIGTPARGMTSSFGAARPFTSRPAQKTRR